MKVKVIQPMPPKGKLFNFKKEESKSKSATTYDASNDYAVIISGGGDNESNWVRYWNDCSAMYSALVNVYNYSPPHIYVIMADGTSSGNDRVLSAYQDAYGYWHFTRDSSPALAHICNVCLIQSGFLSVSSFILPPVFEAVKNHLSQIQTIV